MGRGVPTSSQNALVWQHHGEAAVRSLLDASAASGLATAVASEIDREVVRRSSAFALAQAGSIGLRSGE